MYDRGNTIALAIGMNLLIAIFVVIRPKLKMFLLRYGKKKKIAKLISDDFKEDYWTHVELHSEVFREG